MNINILHIIDSLNSRSGGPSRTVSQLVDNLAHNSDFDVSLLSQSFLNEPYLDFADKSINLMIPETDSHILLKMGLPIRRELIQIINTQRPSLIHAHGLWLPTNFWASKLALQHNIPLLLQPHGMLEPWALNFKKFKKQLALFFYQKKLLESATLFFATSVEEAANFRTIGLRQPIAIIPNGVELDSMPHLSDRPKSVDGIRTVLFLSRIHEKKGLINLVRAWAALKPEGWRLRIAGPDEGQHLQVVMSEARSLGIEDFIEYVGEVDGAKKSSTYIAADIFVLPTFSENFGVVVAEALAHGLPVITTRGTPWADLISYNCGWWIEIGVEPLKNALREAFAMSDSERNAMGLRGQDYVKRYDWGGIAQKTCDVYKWVLGYGAKPKCVEEL